MKSKYSKDQIMVLIGACLFQCALLGVLINCTGVLFAQIRNELGFSMSKISVYNTLKSITTALSAAAVTTFYFRNNKCRFLLLNQMAMILSFLLIVWKAEGVLWYASAVIGGAASCVAYVAVPVLLNQWFPQNGGTATGIAMAFSGIGGAICNPLCAKLIGLAGWRWTIVILGGVMLLLTVPGLILMFRNAAPSPVENSRNSAVEESTVGLPVPGTIFLVCLVFVGGCMGVAFAVNISMFAQSIGYSLSVGASMTTMVMMGNVFTKFLYGLLCDKLGAWKATMLALSVTAVALLCFLFAQRQLAVLYVASLLFGCVYALSVVAISRCCISAYGSQESKRLLGIHTCINSAVMAGTSLLVGVLFDRAQSFTPVLFVLLAAVACSATAAAILIVNSGKMAKV